MEEKPVVTPIEPDTLSFEDKRKVIAAFNLIQEKRCGKIKGRTYVNDSKQNRYFKEVESV